MHTKTFQQFRDFLISKGVPEAAFSAAALPSEINEAETMLGHTLPSALRDAYGVANGMTRLSLRIFPQHRWVPLGAEWKELLRTQRLMDEQAEPSLREARIADAISGPPRRTSSMATGLASHWA